MFRPVALIVLLLLGAVVAACASTQPVLCIDPRILDADDAGDRLPSNSVLHRRQHGQRELVLVLSDACRAEPDEVFERLIQIIAILERLFGPMTADRVVVVESEVAEQRQTRFNQGSVLCVQRGDFYLPPGEWIDLMLAHELAHDWFGWRVYGAMDACPRLDELMSEVASLEVSSELHGQSALAQGVVDSTLVHLDGTRAPVCSPRNRTYEKSVIVFRLLRHVLGREGFYRVARRVIAEHEGQAISVADFISLAERESSMDLGWILRWGFQGDADLDFAIRRVAWDRSGDGVLTRIELEERVGGWVFPLPVPLEISTADGQILRRSVEIAADGATLEISTSASVEAIRVDPDWALWDVDRSNNFFGARVIGRAERPGHQGEGLEVVGGFTSRYSDRTWASAWLRFEDWACLVPLREVRPGPVRVDWEGAGWRVGVGTEPEMVESISPARCPPLAPAP